MARAHSKGMDGESQHGESQPQVNGMKRQKGQYPNPWRNLWRRWRGWRYGGLGLAVSIWLCLGSVSWGQIPLSSTSPAPRSILEALPSPFTLTPPSTGNSAAGNNASGTSTMQVVSRGIWLDGRKLFTIAVPIPRGTLALPSADGSPSESRANLIESRLREIVQRGFDPGSLEVSVEIEPRSRQPVIYARSTQSGQPRVDELMTITALDAELNGSTSESWAEEVETRVETALTKAQQERQPEFVRQQGWIAAGALAIISLTSWILRQWQRRIKAQRQALSAQQKQDSTELSAVSGQSQQPSGSATLLLQQRSTHLQKRRLKDVQWRLSQLAQIFLWGLGLFFVSGLFSYTRWLQPLMVGWVQVPVRLLGVILLTYLAIRLSETLVDRLFWVLESGSHLASDTSQRLILRFTTFSRVAKSIAALVLGTIGLMVAIATLGIAISPALLTIAGIVGVGISLASQNLIKDVINGFLILLEDQYGVGDVISVGEMTGLVENMNLRITQLRSTAGHLITIPNSSISIVQNLSKEWSRVDLSVIVAYEADLDQALAVTKQVAEVMSQDPDWRELILEPPQVLGVDNLNEAGATIRLWIKTQPLKQWDVAREYRRRLKFAFDQSGIPIGIPQQSLWFGGAPEPEQSLPHRHPGSHSSHSGDSSDAIHPPAPPPNQPQPPQPEQKSH